VRFDRASEEEEGIELRRGRKIWVLWPACGLRGIVIFGVRKAREREEYCLDGAQCIAPLQMRGDE